MFCEKCGKPIPEGLTECPDCNPVVQEVEETVQEGAATEAPAVETPAVEAPAVETPAVEPEVFEEPSFEKPVKVKKKRGKKGLVIGGIATSVVAVGLAVIIAFFPGVTAAVKGFFLKTFGSDEDYSAFVQEKTATEYTEVATTVYGSLLESLVAGDMAVDAVVEVNISDEAMTMIKSLLPASYQDLDLSNYKNVKIALNYILNGDKFSLDAALGLGSSSLLNISTILDMAGEDVYLGVTNLSDKYLVFKDVLGELDMEEMQEVYSSVDFEKLAKALPSSEEFNTVLNRYLEIALNNLGEAEKSSEKVTVGDYTEKLTVIEKEVTEKDLLKLCKEVLKEAKSDSDLKKIINNMEEFILEEYGDEIGASIEKGYVYDMFKQAVSTYLEQLEEVEASSEELFTLIEYVNGSHEVVGRELIVEDETIVKYVTVHKGDSFAFELECEEAGLVIEGEGTDKKDTVNATYIIEVQGTDVVEIALDDFSLKDNLLNGSVTVKPTAEAMELITGGDTASSVISMLEPAIKLSFENTQSSSKVTYALLSKGKEYVSLSVSASLSSDKTVTIPSDAIDSEDVAEWMNTLDVDKVVSVINSLKLPAELTEGIDELASSIKSVGGLGTFFMDSYSDLGGNSESYDDYIDYSDTVNGTLDDYGDYSENLDYYDYYDEY